MLLCVKSLILTDFFYQLWPTLDKAHFPKGGWWRSQSIVWMRPKLNLNPLQWFPEHLRTSGSSPSVPPSPQIIPLTHRSQTITQTRGVKLNHVYQRAVIKNKTFYIHSSENSLCVIWCLNFNKPINISQNNFNLKPLCKTLFCLQHPWHSQKKKKKIACW